MWLLFLLALLVVWLFGVVVVRAVVIGLGGRILDWLDPYD